MEDQAVKYGYIRIIKILAPWTENPNAAEEYGMKMTPIHVAATNGNVEMVKVLASFTSTPNAPKTHGIVSLTPIEIARLKGHKDIIMILEDAMNS